MALLTHFYPTSIPFPTCAVLEVAPTPPQPLSPPQPRHQGGAHGGRAPAKIVRAPAKITGLIILHLGCQKFFWYFGAFLALKNRKRPNGNPVFHGG